MVWSRLQGEDSFDAKGKHSFCMAMVMFRVSQRTFAVVLVCAVAIQFGSKSGSKSTTVCNVMLTLHLETNPTNHC